MTWSAGRRTSHALSGHERKRQWIWFAAGEGAAAALHDAVSAREELARLKVNWSPRSLAGELWDALLLVMVGNDSIFLTGLYLHSAGMLFTAMFIETSSGEVLFSEDEADILLYRPVDPRQLLWAKVYVMVKVSTMLASG